MLFKTNNTLSLKAVNARMSFPKKRCGFLEKTKYTPKYVRRDTLVLSIASGTRGDPVETGHSIDQEAKIFTQGLV